MADTFSFNGSQDSQAVSSSEGGDLSTVETNGGPEVSLQTQNVSDPAGSNPSTVVLKKGKEVLCSPGQAEGLNKKAQKGYAWVPVGQEQPKEPEAPVLGKRQRKKPNLSDYATPLKKGAQPIKKAKLGDGADPASGDDKDPQDLEEAARKKLERKKALEDKLNMLADVEKQLAQIKESSSKAATEAFVEAKPAPKAAAPAKAKTAGAKPKPKPAAKPRAPKTAKAAPKSSVPPVPVLVAAPPVAQPSVVEAYELSPVEGGDASTKGRGRARSTRAAAVAAVAAVAAAADADADALVPTPPTALSATRGRGRGKRKKTTEKPTDSTETITPKRAGA